MIEEILPAGVAAADTHEDLLDIPLFPEEERALGRGAVDKRRREFITGRACAREALRQLGLSSVAIPAGARGEPSWPAGVVGSITHCAGYRACAVARTETLVTVGIDAEPNEQLPDGVLKEIARAEERELLRELARCEPSVCWDRLLFSAKEAVYKAWFPLAERWLGFEDATLTVDLARGAFEARLLVLGPLVGTQRLGSLDGRFLVRDGLVLTAVSLPSRND
ncbi:MAG TPA: 4'-phosphopantetheinyl transferase superfamily protein [Solirubrobacteraceae bacterium]